MTSKCHLPDMLARYIYNITSPFLVCTCTYVCMYVCVQLALVENPVAAMPIVLAVPRGLCRRVSPPARRQRQSVSAEPASRPTSSTTEGTPESCRVSIVGVILMLAPDCYCATIVNDVVSRQVRVGVCCAL
jgi:hypothetical protein